MSRFITFCPIFNALYGRWEAAANAGQQVAGKRQCGFSVGRLSAGVYMARVRAVRDSGTLYQAVQKIAVIR